PRTARPTRPPPPRRAPPARRSWLAASAPRCSGSSSVASTRSSTPRPRCPRRYTGEMTSSRVLLAKKAALVALVLGVVVLVVSRIDFARDMHRLDVGMLSGAKDGSYHATVTDLATFAEKKSGHIRNLESAGSGENVTRLAAARNTGKCEVAFG